MVRKKIGELLVESGAITREQLEKALVFHSSTGERLGKVLVKMNIITESELLKVLEQKLGVPLIDPTTAVIDKQVAQLIPMTLAERYVAIPISKNGNRLTVAMADPTNFYAIDDLRMVTQYEIEPALAAEHNILRAIDQTYGVSELVQKSISQMQKDDYVYTSEMETAEYAPVINIVNSLISQAIKSGASDIHLEPMENNMRARLRVDGVLREITTFPKHTQGAIISRVKILANMDIAERRMPQDGRIQVQETGRSVDLRVSSLPTLYGEKIVMRILDQKAVILDVNLLGFTAENLERFRSLYKHSYGMILITGPTGSGKTTTLYSTLTELNSPTKNIITVEDPVEYRLAGVNQVQVNPKAGMTFVNGLRSILRQDPNIIMVGEIRDLDTAEIAIRAALTGHLVLSTLHTNDAAGALTRLVDMGIEPYLVASSVIGVVAQRLVRKVCPECRQEYIPEKGSPECVVLPDDVEACATVYKGTGCLNCSYTGYRGRMAVHEVLPVSSAIRDLLMKRASTAMLAEKAAEEGMRTMQQDGVDKTLEGLTTVSEVLRVAYSENWN